MLELRNVNTFYGNIQALRDVNIRINEGEIVTLIGANGAGKSTTLNILTGYLPPTSGQVLVDGMEVGHGAGDSKKEAEQHAAFSVAQYMSDEQCASLLDKVDRLEGTRSGSGF